jgi:hypothetical protein
MEGARETFFRLQFRGDRAPKQNIRLAGEFQPSLLYCQSVNGRVRPVKDQDSEEK